MFAAMPIPVTRRGAFRVTLAAMIVLWLAMLRAQPAHADDAATVAAFSAWYRRALATGG